VRQARLPGAGGDCRCEIVVAFVVTDFDWKQDFQDMEETEFRQWAKDQMRDETRFIRAVLSGRRHGQQQKWRRVVVRPVVLRSKRHLQVSYFDEKRDITKNYTGDEITSMLDQLLALPFSHFTLQTTERETQVRISKKGKLFVQEKEKTQSRSLPTMDHDREKDVLISVKDAGDFLRAVGILTPDGRIKSSMQRKYRQINEFLRLIVETRAFERITKSPISIIDCGCGSAHLTFAIYHYLNSVVHTPALVTGIDLKADLLDQQTRLTRELGWEGIRFYHSAIIEFTPETAPDIVLALHACDTATDEALAQAIRWGSYMIFSAPCCHHNLQAQLAHQVIPDVFKPVMRHGILKERLGDVLTDSLRAQLMRVMGYRTEVIEFISAEHTDKNLMIRGVRTSTPGEPQAIEEYRKLKAFFHVQPHLEMLLADAVREYQLDV
jgi:SAM-dependent methyltransferase